MAKSKKKKEKKADFAVADPPPPAVPDGVENQAEGRQGKTQASQLHRYFLQVSNQTLDNAFLEGEARRSAAFTHQLTMTKHYAENQRKGASSPRRQGSFPDAVISLHNHLSQNLAGATNSTSLSPLIAHLAPLILDTSSSVRTELVGLLNALSPQVVPKEALHPHISMLLLYIQSAMTHIQSDIRSDSTKFVSWILGIGHLEVVRAAWAKVLTSFAGLLGWTVSGQEKSRIQLSRGSESLVGNANVTGRHIAALHEFLFAGISETTIHGKDPRPKTIDYAKCKTIQLQHPLIECYLLPSYSAPFAHLNLFSSASSQPEVQSSHDVVSRRTQFEQLYLGPLIVYLQDLSAELIPSDLSRQSNQTTMDDLRVSVIRILALIKHVYIDGDMEQEGKKAWDKDWKRCIAKIGKLVEARTRSEGSRRILREWENLAI